MDGVQTCSSGCLTMRSMACALSRLFAAMVKAARHAARHQPTNEDIYPIALLMDAKGNVICDEQGMPVVTQVPLNVVSVEGRKVYFEYIEQMAVATCTSAIEATVFGDVNRAVRAGELPRPVQISSRRVAHHLADVRHWIARKATPAK
jgi:predicted DNA-binding transcriptional regulator AlpA